MINVRLHLHEGTVWVDCTCAMCLQLHRLTIAQALAGPIACARCGHFMDIKAAVIETIDRMPGTKPPAGNGDGNDG